MTKKSQRKYIEGWVLILNSSGESNCGWLLLCCIHGMFLLKLFFQPCDHFCFTLFSSRGGATTQCQASRSPQVPCPQTFFNIIQSSIYLLVIVSLLISENLIITTLQTQLKKKVWKKAQLIRFLWRAISWHQNNLSSEFSSCCETTMAVKPDNGPSVPKEYL